MAGHLRPFWTQLQHDDLHHESFQSHSELSDSILDEIDQLTAEDSDDILSQIEEVQNKCLDVRTICTLVSPVECDSLHSDFEDQDLLPPNKFVRVRNQPIESLKIAGKSIFYISQKSFDIKRKRSKVNISDISLKRLFYDPRHYPFAVNKVVKDKDEDNSDWDDLNIKGESIFSDPKGFYSYNLSKIRKSMLPGTVKTSSLGMVFFFIG